VTDAQAERKGRTVFCFKYKIFKIEISPHPG